MSGSAGSKGSEEAVPQPGLSVIERDPRDALVRSQGEPAGRRSWYVVDSWVHHSLPGRSRSGDLIEGIVAVAALLLMLAVGVTPWLAIPLAIMTYSAVYLLRPTDHRQDEPSGGTVVEEHGIDVIAEAQGHGEVPDGMLAGIEDLATSYRLTRREQEILPLLAQRLTDREIAERFSISHRTAMNHTANILGKLGLTSRRDVATFVAQHGRPPSSIPPHDNE